MEELVAVELVDVRADQTTGNPMVILRATSDAMRVAERPTLLAIFIGNIEAQAIRIGVEKRATPRPMTHDLLASIISATGATVQSVVITETKENIFYAEVRLAVGDSTNLVSARPSDAIALAVRIGAPIYVRAELMEEQGVVEQSGESGSEQGGDPDVIVDQFRQFLDDINPDDFKG